MTPIIELRLLGSAELYRRTGAVEPLVAVDAVLRQPKRLTLLAYLLLAARQGLVRRDVVLAAFWPDLDEQRARAALRQALHFLRQHLGDDVIDTRGDDLGVAAGRVVSDVEAFEQALVAERWGTAASLYRGPFLAGIHAGGPAVDEWLARERSRLHDGAHQAVDELSRAAEAAGDLSEAVRRARDAVALAPTHEPTTRRLMRLLEAAGERGEALAAYAALERRLRDELDTAPSPRTVAAADALRTQAAAARSAAGPSAASSPGGNAGSDGAVVAVPPRARDAAPAEADALRPASPTRPDRRPMRLHATMLALVAVLVVVALGLRAVGSEAAPEAGPGPVRLAVLPFEEVGGEGAERYFVDGIAEAISARLASFAMLEVIDPRGTAEYRASRSPASRIGEELDADYVLTATVRWTRERDGSRTARVTPTLVRTDRGTVVWEGDAYVASAADPFTVQAEIAGDVAGALDLALSPGAPHVATASPTRNAEAYDHYLRGLDAYRRYTSYQRRPDLLAIAVEQFRLATRRDTAFALAHAWLARTLIETRAPRGARTDPTVMREFHAALDRARALHPELPEAIVAHGMYLQRVVGDVDRALHEFDRASALRPDDAALLLQRVRYTKHTFGVHDSVFARDVAIVERAVRLDPRSPATLRAMMAVLARQRRFEEAEVYARRLTEVEPEGFTYGMAGRFALLSRGDTVRARAFAEAGMRNSTAPHIVLLHLAHMVGADFARAVDTLDVADIIKGAQQTAHDSTTLYMLKLGAAQRLGRASAARIYADSARRLLEASSFRPDNPPLDLGFVYAALGRTDDATRILRRRSAIRDSVNADLASKGRTVHAGRLTGNIGYTLAQLAAGVGDGPEMTRHLTAALAAPDGVTPQYVRLDPAFAAWRGRPDFEAVLAAAPPPPNGRGPSTRR